MTTSWLLERQEKKRGVVEGSGTGRPRGTAGSGGEQVVESCPDSCHCSSGRLGCYAAGADRAPTTSLLHKGNDWPRQWLALDQTSADTPLSELEDSGEGRGSGAHMISTARVAAEKPVRIAFSLDNA
ncbi:hypothetical protein J0S82_004413, partial [Galemys pyrenaicus]